MIPKRRKGPSKFCKDPQERLAFSTGLTNEDMRERDAGEASKASTAHELFPEKDDARKKREIRAARIRDGQTLAVAPPTFVKRKDGHLDAPEGSTIKTFRGLSRAFEKQEVQDKHDAPRSEKRKRRDDEVGHSASQAKRAKSGLLGSLPFVGGMFGSRNENKGGERKRDVSDSEEEEEHPNTVMAGSKKPKMSGAGEENQKRKRKHSRQDDSDHEVTGSSKKKLKG